MSIPPYMAAKQPPRVQPAAKNKAVLILASIVGGILLVGGTCFAVVLYIVLTPVVQEVQAAAKQTEAENSARELGQLIVNYEIRNGKMPVAEIKRGSGRDSEAVLSWRVSLLPFMQERDMADQLQLDKRWDDPANLPITSRPLKAFSSPLCPDSQGSNRTAFVAVVGPKTVIRASRPVTMRDISDGTSNTGMLLELRQSDIAWAEPRDISLDDAVTLIQSCPDRRGLNVVMADGSVRSISPETSTRSIIRLFNCDDGPP